MDPDSRIYFWLTTLRVTWFIWRMCYLFLRWMSDLVWSKHKFKMAGSFEMAREFSQWYSCQMTIKIQLGQKVSKPSWLNVTCTEQICKASVRRSANAMHTATNISSNFNLTLLSRSLLFKTLLKLQGICAFLPKLNPIGYFWEMAKKFLCNNCDYLFSELKKNLLKALDVVLIQAIHHLEHWLFHWMEAYQAGFGSVQVQLQVKKFSYMKYKSHRYIPEHIANILTDAHMMQCLPFKGGQSGPNEKGFSLNYCPNNYCSWGSFLSIQVHCFGREIRNQGLLQGGKTFAHIMQCLSELEHSKKSGNLSRFLWIGNTKGRTHQRRDLSDQQQI